MVSLRDGLKIDPSAPAGHLPFPKGGMRGATRPPFEKGAPAKRVGDRIENHAKHT